MLFPFSLTKNDQLVSSDDSPLILVGRPENFSLLSNRRRDFDGPRVDVGYLGTKMRTKITNQQSFQMGVKDVC